MSWKNKKALLVIIMIYPDMKMGRQICRWSS